MYFLCLILDSSGKGFEMVLNKGFLFHFSSMFSSTQPAAEAVLGNADLRHHLLRLNQTTQHISCSVKQEKWNITKHEFTRHIL